MPEGLIVLHDAGEGRWLRFTQPCKIFSVYDLSEVKPSLGAAESLVRENGWVAVGLLSYEAAGAFDPALRTHVLGDFPLLWIGLYEKHEIVDLPEPDYDRYTLSQPEPSISRDAYDNAINRIREHIRAGDTYQVNYTIRLNASFRGEPWHLFLSMVRAQSPGYSAYVDVGRYAICSASPELFFRLDKDRITCRPMKGTVRRGRTLEEDKFFAKWLQGSEKNQAENLMIVDMIRNDLGRVAEIGTVDVSRMFEVEKHPTLWQMTSTITAHCTRSLSDIMTALFPCASITGAPKIRTSEIIAALEPDARKIYTGCIGFLTPDRTAQFNVAIRTAVVDRLTQTVEYGSGGGVVWDSVSGDEYTEVLLKARVLTERQPEFALLETLRWTREEGYFLLEYHMRRIAESAEYFGYQVDMQLVRSRLREEAAVYGAEARRVRLLVSRDGSVEIQSRPLVDIHANTPLRIALADKPVDRSTPFLYHKTTLRNLYESEKRLHPNHDDVLLWNDKGEITESCTANLVVELDQKRWTPPVDCGLLPGTFRAHLLEEGEIEERRLSIADLSRCSKLWLINSVRKWQEAVLDPSSVIAHGFGLDEANTH